MIRYGKALYNLSMNTLFFNQLSNNIIIKYQESIAKGMHVHTSLTYMHIFLVKMVTFTSKHFYQESCDCAKGGTLFLSSTALDYSSLTFLLGLVLM